MKYTLGLLILVALLTTGCANNVAKLEPQVKIDAINEVTNSGTKIEEPAPSTAPAPAPAVITWPAFIPEEIPVLKSGEIIRAEDLSAQPVLEFQPEKFQVSMTIVNLTKRNVLDYLQLLKKDGWVTSETTNLPGSPVYFARKGKYVIEVELDSFGPNTAYYYVMLSEQATKALGK